MFQYAMGRRISIEYERPLWIDVARYRRDNKRAYSLGPFGIEAQIAPPGMCREFHAPFDRLRRLRRLIAIIRGSRWAWILEHSTPRPQALRRAGLGGRPLYVEGYWQSPTWFEGIEDALRQEFKLREPIPADLEKIVAAGDRDSAVGVHVRRGDFVNDPHIASMYSVCTRDYYEQAACFVREKIPRARFLLFSDDPAWVDANLRLANEQLVVPTVPDRSATIDLMMLSMCRHLILSNSTFSWWAAWISEGTGGIRVSPDRWFADGRPDPPGLIPRHWARIGVNGKG